MQEEIFPKLNNVNFIYRCPWLPSSLEIISRPLEQDKINLFSSESLGGDYFTPCFPDKARYITIDNLKKLFPDAKIIIGIRKYNTWILSLYKQYALMGTLSFKDWLENSDPNKFKIDIFLDYIKKTFPKTFIYEQEYLLYNRYCVIESICKFIGCETPEISNNNRNISLTGNKIKKIVSMNRFFNMDINGLKDPRFPYSIIRYGINLLDERKIRGR